MKISFPLALAAAFHFVSPAAAQQVSGSGSSFAAPLYAKWGEMSALPPPRGGAGVTLSYSATGSGAGVQAVTARTVDFGASDAPVAADRLRERQLLQFPVAVGAVNVIVNVTGIAANRLKLSGPVLADIYAGSITRWDDQRIKAINPGTALPPLPVAPVVRSDSSGTTFVFTGYLAMVSPDWKSHVGSGTAVHWPGGIPVRGSDGVATAVADTPGAIGYIEGGLAETGKLVTVQLQNAAGRFVVPTETAYAATAQHADWNSAQNFAVDLNNQPGDDSWPIETVTFALVPENPSDPARALSAIRFFDLGFSRGGDAARALHYVALPGPVQDAVRRAWRSSVHGPDGRPLF